MTDNKKKIFTMLTNVDRYTRAGKNGKLIYCPKCKESSRVYHFSWCGLQCQVCKERVEKNDWLVELNKQKKKELVKALPNIENLPEEEIIARKNGIPMIFKINQHVSVGDNYEGKGIPVINFASTYIISGKKTVNEQKRIELIVAMNVCEDLLSFERSDKYDKNKTWWFRSFAIIVYEDSETVEVVEEDWYKGKWKAEDLVKASRVITNAKNLIENFE